MQELMKYLDIFETKFNFYSDKKKIYYTTLGGILSIITFCLCLFTFFFFVKDDIQRISPDKLFISNILEKEYETILIDKKLFIPWRIINKNNELIDNNELINPIVTYYYPEKNSTNEIIQKSKIINYKLCSETSLGNSYDKNLIGVKLNKLYCIDSNEIESSSMIPYMNYINIDFYINKNKINNISDYIEIEIYFPEILFEPTNLNTPININYKKYSYNINKYSKKTIKIFLQKNILLDDKGWFAKSITKYSYWAVSKIVGDTYFSYEDNNICSISINIEQNNKKYIRSYKKIYSIISEGIPIISLLFIILKQIAIIIKTTQENLKLVGLLFENLIKKRSKILNTKVNDINNKNGKSKPFSECGKPPTYKSPTLSKFRKNVNINNNGNNCQINSIQNKFGITSINLKKQHQNDNMSILKNDNSNSVLLNLFPKNNNNHINQLANQDDVKIMSNYFDDNRSSISNNNIRYVPGKLFPYRYYFFLIFFKSLDISKYTLCFPKKFVKVNLFLGQLLDISNYLLLQKEVHLLKNKCLTKEEVNKLENHKINIGSRKFIKMVNECIESQKFDILDVNK